MPQTKTKAINICGALPICQALTVVCVIVNILSNLASVTAIVFRRQNMMGVKEHRAGKERII